MRFTKCLVHVAYGCGSVLLLRRDTLCAFGFVHDIMFIFYGGPYAVRIVQRRRQGGWRVERGVSLPAGEGPVFVLKW